MDRATFALDDDYWSFVGLKLEPEELGTVDRDPGHFIRYHRGQVTLFEDDDTVVIGNFGATYMDVMGAMRARVSVIDVFDTTAATFDYLDLYDLDSCRFTPAALKAAGDDDWLFESNLLILDRLELLPQYRGNGYGLHALIGMMHWFQSGAGMVAMKPFPLQFEGGFKDDPAGDPLELAKFKGGEIAARTKLRRYYSQLGFSLVKKTQFMVRAVDQLPPSFPRLSSPPERERPQASL